MVSSTPNVGADVHEQLEQKSMEFAYDAFSELKDKHLERNQESYNKYMYALKLRREAANQIGIENIRLSRIARLQREQETIEGNYRKGQKVCPDFRLVLMVRLEA